MILTCITLLIIGLIVLVVYSDIFVDAASSLSIKLKIPKILVALTIASFGTCAPELAISFNSIRTGNIDMTIANVIGSSIVNILLIVGLAAIIKPIKVKERTSKKELPILALITTTFFFLISDSLFKKSAINGLSRQDAIVLLCCFLIFILYIFIVVRKNKNDDKGRAKYPLKKSILLIIFSLVAIIIASDIVVDNAVILAEQIGISQKVIAMTVIVIGTSLPELIMTIESARKGEFDMAVGNIIGTNIFNICIVLGLPIAIYGGVSSGSFNMVDTSIVLLSALIFYFFGKSGKELSRREGIMMVLVFIAYYTYVIATF